MHKFIETFPVSKETEKILLQVCKKYNIRHEKEIVDIYRHKPDLFFQEKDFSKECWNEISTILSDPSNPYMPKDSVISFKKATLIVKRNKLIEELAELSKDIRQIK